MAQTRMRRAICFDTTPLIWGVREDADSGDEHMILKCKKYIEFLNLQRYAIMVPSVVVSEYFVGATNTQLHELELIKRGYEHPSHDLRSAVLAAKLQRGNVVNEIHEEFKLSKRSIKVDAMIIAIAIVNEAEKIITHNIQEFKKLANGQILIEGIPDIHEPPDLFESFERAEADEYKADVSTEED